MAIDKLCNVAVTSIVIVIAMFLISDLAEEREMATLTICIIIFRFVVISITFIKIAAAFCKHPFSVCQSSSGWHLPKQPSRRSPLTNLDLESPCWLKWQTSRRLDLVSLIFTSSNWDHPTPCFAMSLLQTLHYLKSWGPPGSQFWLSLGT